MKTEIIMSGFGGQGVMLASHLLCYAGMHEGKEVTYFPSYGAEIRGGTVVCQIIIANTAIGAPTVKHPDILIALNKYAFERFMPQIKDATIVFANTSLYDPVHSRGTVIGIPAQTLAEHSGMNRASNMVMLGAFAAKTGIVTQESLLNAIPDVLIGKESSWEGNSKAIEQGFSFIQMHK